jgi:hypothetical protein
MDGRGKGDPEIGLGGKPVMRVPRVRFTVRQLMIVGALVAVLMAVGVGLQRRTAHLERLSASTRRPDNRQASRF